MTRTRSTVYLSLATSSRCLSQFSVNYSKFQSTEQSSHAPLVTRGCVTNQARAQDLSSRIYHPSPTPPTHAPNSPTPPLPPPAAVTQTSTTLTKNHPRQLRRSRHLNNEDNSHPHPASHQITTTPHLRRNFSISYPPLPPFHHLQNSFLVLSSTYKVLKK